MQRKQKTDKTGCPCEDTLETNSSMEAFSIDTLETEEKNGARNLLEEILQKNNLKAAYKRVKQNGGAPGVDNMTVAELKPYLEERGAELITSIREGRYKPQPVRRVEIPKPNGGVRLLGVPTVIDRMIQQAIVQVLQPLFDLTFSNSSYGFRPNRNAQQAIKQAKEYYDEGYTQVVDIDLAKYFDTVNHDILMGLVGREVKDKAVLKLIRKCLKSGVMQNGLVSPTTEGTPQGGNLSPLLSNIYLNEFDRLLKSRGHRFIRYADDCNIYVKSRRAAIRVMENCTKFLEGKLKLKVNREKSNVGSPTERKFLGFALFKVKEETRIVPHKESINKFKEKVRQLTSRNQGNSIETILAHLKEYTVGWVSYYGIANLKSIFQTLNGWTRRRIRQIFWKQWKGIKAKHKNLKQLGASKDNSWRWANSRLGCWRIAGSPILSTTLTNNYLSQMGYDDILERYERIQSMILMRDNFISNNHKQKPLADWI